MKLRGLLNTVRAAARAFETQNPHHIPTYNSIDSKCIPTHGWSFTSPRTSSFLLFQDQQFFWNPARCGISTAAERVSDKEADIEILTKATAPVIGLGPTRNDQKPRVVVLGTGWGAARVLKDLNTRIYDVVCISPRNHMVFTPLLASTCVGTLEFRSVAEPVRTIQPALSYAPDSYYYLARCTGIDTENHEVHCEAVLHETQGEGGGEKFKVAYDKLVIGTGAVASTFGIDGVYKHAIFLRDVKNAMDIRTKLLLNLMNCEIPGKSLEEKKRLLHCVVVGGGPTGVEFSGELSDFIQRDVHRKFSHVKDFIAVTLIEAKEILSSFDVRLRQYATSQLQKTGVQLKHGMVKHVFPEKLELTDGTEVPYGLLVWSTGVGPSSFVKSLPFEKSKGGRIGVDDNLRVPGYEDVYAVGDCSGYLESTGKPELPALAQVAERQGKYLAHSLNMLGKSGHARAGSGTPLLKPFVYKHLGSMATVGRYKALVDLRESPDKGGLSLTGFKSWLIWRSAYLTRVVSWRNRLYVAINWATTFFLVVTSPVSRGLTRENETHMKDNNTYVCQHEL